MAGVKGRSGGARPNSGGKREGAGRKPKAPGSTVTRDPLQFLLDVMQGKVDPSPAQLKAAQAAAQYVHAKKGEGGKKEAKGDAAKAAGAGRFAPASGPRLAAVDGRQVAGAKRA